MRGKSYSSLTLIPVVAGVCLIEPSGVASTTVLSTTGLVVRGPIYSSFYLLAAFITLPSVSIGLKGRFKNVLTTLLS